MDQDAPVQRPPDGARCATHDERTAHYVCPHCRAYACLGCYHGAVQRCERCLRPDPAGAVAPVPFEEARGDPLGRYLRTLATALSPVRTAPAFAAGEVASARRFALWSALPLAALAGVIPHTRTLLFAGDFSVRVLGKPTPDQILIDVLSASALQALISGVELLCLLLPFRSLVRAYAPGREAAAERVVYYRFWILPAALCLLYLVVWASPAPPTAQSAAPVGVQIAFLVRTFMPVLLFVAMSATARLACGLGPWMSLVVVAIPMALLMLGEALVGAGLEHVMPPPPQAV